MMCQSLLGGMTKEDHDRYVCSAKKYVCLEPGCGRRYHLAADRDKHRRKAHDLPA